MNRLQRHYTKKYIKQVSKSKEERAMIKNKQSEKTNIMSKKTTFKDKLKKLGAM